MCGKTLIAFVSLAAVAGCGTIHRAKSVQAVVDAETRPDALPQRVVPTDLRLSALVDFALTNRPSVVSSRLAVMDARLAMREIAAGSPVISSTPLNAFGLSLTGGHSESSAGATWSDAQFRTRGNASAGLSLDLLIYDFGRNAAEKKAQAERVIAAETDFIKVSYDVFREVANDVLDCREADELLMVAETNAVAAAAHLEQAERRAEQGEVQKLDVLKARLTLAQAAEKLVAASNAVTTAESELVYALGCAKGDREELKQMIPETREMIKPIELPTVDDEHAFVTYALTNAPVIRIARARVKAASAGVDRAIADLYPTISASTAFSWSDPLWYFKWGFSGVESLFTGFRKTTAVDRAVVAMMSASAQLNETSLALARDLEITLTTRHNAIESLRTAENTRRMAEENLTLVSRQYQIGEANRVDYADALKAVTDARADEVKAGTMRAKADAALYALAGLNPMYE